MPKLVMAIVLPLAITFPVTMVAAYGLTRLAVPALSHCVRTTATWICPFATEHVTPSSRLRKIHIVCPVTAAPKSASSGRPFVTGPQIVMMQLKTIKPAMNKIALGLPRLAYLKHYSCAWLSLPYLGSSCSCQMLSAVPLSKMDVLILLPKELIPHHLPILQEKPSHRTSSTLPSLR